MNHNWLLYLSACLLIISGIQTRPALITTPQDLISLFPTSVEEITKRSQSAQNKLQNAIANIVGIAPQKRTFANTAYALDEALNNFRQESAAIGILERVSPDKDIRHAAQKTVIDLNAISLKLVEYNAELYHAFKCYKETNSKFEKLTAEQSTFLIRFEEDWLRNGIALPQTTQAKLTELQNKITQLESEFVQNISSGLQTIFVTREELVGCPENFIRSLEQNSNGLYIVKADPLSSSVIAETCVVESTRKTIYGALLSRAYPENVPVLSELISKRHEMAQLHGYTTYAEYDCANQMAQSVQEVRTFLEDLEKKIANKYEQEFMEITEDLPAHITLSSTGKINPWDMGFIAAHYKKKRFSVDEGLIAEYFPVDHTLDKLIEIYEQFMNIRITQLSIEGFWHSEVKVLQVHDHLNKLRGYILLDLHPRPNKYSQAASFPIVPSILRNGNPTPSVNVVVANFPKPTANKPALLKHENVKTFFHEFGHALHSIFGSTELAYFSGTRVKRDFVELPSKMLEEWIWDKQILKTISCHYKTHEPLPDEIIDNKIKLRKQSGAFFLTRQLYLARLSLEIFGNTKNINALDRCLYEQYCFKTESHPDSHVSFCFDHLAGYGSKYYGYLWATVFAKDVFSEIKQHGLLNPEIGQKYVNTILAKGGSEEPHDLLVKFLGREPNSQAFFEALL
jgi:thimet oligopeptidase